MTSDARYGLVILIVVALGAWGVTLGLTWITMALLR
jgi:hypothetical protein